MSYAVIETLRAQAPLLIVLAPMIACVIAALCPSGLAAWVVAIFGALAALAVASIAALGFDGPSVYALGGWPAPLGVELRIDGLAAYGLVVVAAAGATAIIGATASLRAELDRPRQPLAAALTLAALTGAFGIVVAGDLFVLFGFLQWIWISLAALVALGADRDRRAGPAAFNVLILGSIGAVLFAFGAGLISLATGTIDIEQAAGVLNAAEGARSAAAGLALMAAAVAMVAGLAPLNAWAVGSFARGPAWTSLVFGAVLPAAGAIAVGRMIALAASATAPGLLAGLTTGLVALGVLSALFGSVQALAARDLRRMTVYTVAGQAGCVVIGLSAASAAGIAGGLFHLANQTAIAFTMFAVAVAIRRENDAAIPLSALDGLFKRAPLLSIALSVAMLSLIGVPMTAGFLSRWSLLQATLEARLWWGAAAIILTSFAAIVCAVRVFERLFVRPAAEGAFAPRTIALAPGLLLATLITLAFGLNGAAPLNAASAAAASLAWGGP